MTLLNLYQIKKKMENNLLGYSPSSFYLAHVIITDFSNYQ